MGREAWNEEVTWAKGVAAVQQGPRLTVLADGPLSGKEYLLRDGTQILGRGTTADLVVPAAFVSGRHALVRWDARSHAATITDVGSTNGTSVNGRRIENGRATPLRPGDVVDLGGLSLRFELDSTPGFEHSPASGSAINNRFDGATYGDFYQAEHDINIRNRHEHRYEIPDPMEELFKGRGVGRALMALGLLVALGFFAIWMYLIFSGMSTNDPTAPSPFERTAFGLPVAMLAFAGFAIGGVLASIGHAMSRAARTREHSYLASRAHW